MVLRVIWDLELELCAIDNDNRRVAEDVERWLFPRRDRSLRGDGLVIIVRACRDRNVLLMICYAFEFRRNIHRLLLESRGRKHSARTRYAFAARITVVFAGHSR